MIPQTLTSSRIVVVGGILRDGSYSQVRFRGHPKTIGWQRPRSVQTRHAIPHHFAFPPRSFVVVGGDGTHSEAASRLRYCASCFKNRDFISQRALCVIICIAVGVGGGEGRVGESGGYVQVWGVRGWVVLLVQSLKSGDTILQVLVSWQF